MATRDPEQTRGRILQAAGRLFYRDGIRSVAMGAVAEMACMRARFEGMARELRARDPVALSEQLAILLDGAIAIWLVRRDARAAARAREAAVVVVQTALPTASPTGT